MPRLRSNRKAIFGLISAGLVIFFMWTLLRHGRHNGSNPSPYVILEDPVELLVTEEDLARAQSRAALNSTLGFEKILALSGRSSWRRRGLLRASNHAGLRIDVIEPSPPSDLVLEEFMSLGHEMAAKTDRGSALAWLGHLAVLRKVVDSGYETVLIVEDDVDFDIAIKTQMQRLASGIDYFTNTSQNELPYGSGWDTLWLGHCGEAWYRGRSSLQYPDASRIDQSLYIGWKETSFEVIRDGHRLVQWASGPTCSFAYAVTSRGAKQILEAANKARSTAFDTELNALCLFGGLKCITVMPPLFVHYVPKKRKGEYVSEVERESRHGDKPADDSHFDLEMGTTRNIANSTRCMAMFGTSCLETQDRQPREIWPGSLEAMFNHT